MHRTIVSLRNACPGLGTVLATAVALTALGLAGCGSSQTPKADPKAAAAAESASAKPAAPASDNKAATEKKDEPHCFLGDSEASDYAHELMLSVLSSAKFADKKFTRASTPENLKSLESSLRQQMFRVSCKKPFSDDADTVEGALLVLALMNMDDAQWNAALALIGAPPSFRSLPSDVQDWLKEPGTLESVKSASRATNKAAADLLTAAAKELKCGKDAVSVHVKSRRVVQVDCGKRSAVMRDDGGWRREAQ